MLSLHFAERITSGYTILTGLIMHHCYDLGVDVPPKPQAVLDGPFSEEAESKVCDCFVVQAVLRVLGFRVSDSRTGPLIELVLP